MTVVITDKGHAYAYTADSIAEYIRRIEYLKPSHRMFFRGLSSSRYDLSPSINRSISDDVPETWLSRESRLVEFAEQSMPELFVRNNPTFLLANMQHYGIPTRMLDVTENALVALFFACADDSVDGKVVVFDGVPCSAFNPYANIIADTYRLTGNLDTPLDRYIYKIYHQEYARSLIYPNWEKNNQSELLERLRQPIIVDVGNINARQKNQTGKFVLFPNIIDGNFVRHTLMRIDANDEMVFAFIRIPKERKAKIRSQFEFLGMTESFIFPDDINKVFNGIKNKLRLE